MVYPLSRSETTLTSNFSLTADSANEDSVRPGTTFDDSSSSTGSDKYYTVDGVRLVDGKHSKLFLVASDGNGVCVCSDNLGPQTVEPGGTLSLTATFAAPDSDVDTLDVVIPAFGTIADVPVR